MYIMRIRKFNESVEKYNILKKIQYIIDELSVDNINNFAITLDVNLYTGLYSKAYDYMFYCNGDKYEISDNAKSFYTLKINDEKVDMGKYPWSMNAPTIEKDLLTAVTTLYKKINTFYLSSFNKWYRLFFNYLVTNLNEDRKDLIDKIEEFEVIRNNKIDWISLNSLYDFYETPFDKESIRNYFSTKIRNHSITLND